MVAPKSMAMRAVCLLQLLASTSATWNFNGLSYPDLPASGPKAPPNYMVDNEHNTHHAAPDKGKQDGPLWPYSGSLEAYMANLRAGKVVRGGYEPDGNQTHSNATSKVEAIKADSSSSASSSFWLTTLGPLGSQPLAGNGYKFYRDVVADYGADNTGKTDASEALNAAVSDGNRCGQSCGNDLTQGAIIYFPPGTYRICSPVIQLYYTQFIGNPLNPPVIQGCSNFSGIALFDTDPYIPGGNGAEWYVNQNQFFRQIRNFIFDLTKMPVNTNDNGQPLAPTGLHWQAAQATSLQNLIFNMPVATSTSSNVTAVGIFMENGSGGFVSDLTFNGGSIGWRAGSQQYTARNLQFNSCLTAVQMIWDWGFTWQNVAISGGAVAFNISGHGGVGTQGVGAVSIIDSTISNVPIGILTNSQSTSPNIVLDNVAFNSVNSAVQVDGGSTILKASGTVPMWSTGSVYNGSTSVPITGSFPVPKKASNLLTGSNKLFVQSRPQYETYAASSFLVATTDGGCKNDGTGDQANCINVFLQKAVAAQKIAYFPAGIYQVGSTVFIPTGSRVQGSSWSQIMGSGYYFGSMLNPKVMVQVGNAGDVGTMEIVEMLFTVKGNTAGAILLEWNTAAETQGAAAMWDSHFRVGGAAGTALGKANCPKGSFNPECIAATMMFHVTPQASGYFENVWAWVADHDNDDNVVNNADPSSSQVSVYGARGMLIESQGPSWFYGTSSEHSVLYNYQLSGAQNIYMGFIQTETPYYQPSPYAPAPFNVSASFANDPTFSNCNASSNCAAWGLRIVDSKIVTIHGAGHYSFFQNYAQTCLSTYNCQKYMVEVTGSTGVVIFNLATVGTSEFAKGIDNTGLFQNASQRGFTTEDAIWLPLPGDDDIATIFVGPPVFTTPSVTCNEPTCLLVLPTSSLATPATIEVGSYTTSFEYGGFSTITTQGVTTVTFETTTTTTVLSIPPTTISAMSYSNYNVTSGIDPTITVSPSVNLPPVTITLPNGSGSTTTRVVTLPPWPEIEGGGGSSTSYSFATGPQTGSETYYVGVTSTFTATGPTVATITFPATVSPTTLTCPPQSEFTFVTPAITVATECSKPTTWTVDYICPTTTVVTFIGATTAPVSVDCSFSTLWQTSATGAATTTTTTTPLPIYTTWPQGVIIPVTTSVSGPEPTGGGSYQRCDLWFFSICINFHIEGFYWSFPPGIYPPGPPPFPEIEFPPGFTLEGSLPPWPKITIGTDGELTYSSEPTSCHTESASICSFTTSYAVTATGTHTSTTATAVSSTCQTIYGCSVSYSSTATQTTSTDACAPSPSGKAQKQRRQLDSFPELNSREIAQLERESQLLEERGGSSNCPNPGAIIYLKDPLNVGDVPEQLNGLNPKAIQSTFSKYVAFYWVPSMPYDLLKSLQGDPAVSDAFYYYEFNQKTYNYPADQPLTDPSSTNNANNGGPDIAGTQTDSEHTNSTLEKRAATSAISPYPNDAVISLPPGYVWKGRQSGSSNGQSGPNALYNYYFDDTAGSGMTIYDIGEFGVNTKNPEFANNQPRLLTQQSTWGYTGYADLDHGTQVAGAAIGAELGSAKRASLVSTQLNLSNDDKNTPRDWFLDGLLAAWDDMNANGRSPSKSVINLSFGAPYGYWPREFHQNFYRILRMMDAAGATIVVAAGNSALVPGRAGIDAYPQLFAMPNNPLARAYKTSDPNDLGYIPNMIVVGSINQFGVKAPKSQTADFLTIYAPGNQIIGAQQNGNNYAIIDGTSFATPAVSGLVAYLKALPSQWQTQFNQGNSQGPAAIKSMIVALQKSYRALNKVTLPNIVWNGMLQVVDGNGVTSTTNCLTQFPNGGGPNGNCPNLPNQITGYTPPGSCDAIAARDFYGNDTFEFEARQAGSCTLTGGGNPLTITFTNGPTAGPTCPGSCGGTVCAGYFCQPTPTGLPPGYQAPNDPSSSGATVKPTTVTQGFAPSSTSVSSSSTKPTTTPPTTSAPSPTTSQAPPEATCSVQGEFNGAYGYVWTNYVTDNGAALSNAINKACSFDGGSPNSFEAHTVNEQYTDNNGLKWTANRFFSVFLPPATHPQFYRCLNAAITAAGGNPNVAACPYSAPICTPPCGNSPDAINGTSTEGSSDGGG